MISVTKQKFNTSGIIALASLATLLLSGATQRSFAQAPRLPKINERTSQLRRNDGKVLPFVPWTRKGMPPGSYLFTPARSQDELKAQLNSSPELMKKYLSVFRGNTAKEIRSYLSTLVLMQLDHDTPYDVYYWHQDGAGARRRMVRKGTFVFADPDTKAPVLVQVCGNPLKNLLGLPPELKPMNQTSSIQEFLEDEPLPPRRTVVLDEMQMFDMGSIQLVAPRARNIDVNLLPRPSIGRFAAVTPVVPPITPPIVPSVIPPTVPPLIPPIIRADPVPSIPEPGVVTLLFSSLSAGLAASGSALRRRKRRR